MEEAVHTATASGRSTNNQEEVSVLNILSAISTSEPDDARWEKVDHVKMMLANGTYHVSLAQVVAKIIDEMLERGTHHRKGGRSIRMINRNSHVAEVYDCEESQNKRYEADGREARAANRHET